MSRSLTLLALVTALTLGGCTSQAQFLQSMQGWIVGIMEYWNTERTASTIKVRFLPRSNIPVFHVR